MRRRWLAFGVVPVGATRWTHAAVRSDALDACGGAQLRYWRAFELRLMKATALGPFLPGPCGLWRVS